MLGARAAVADDHAEAHRLVAGAGAPFDGMSLTTPS
jgi:hypothetical protein